jgi:hypothetical protein
MDKFTHDLDMKAIGTAASVEKLRHEAFPFESNVVSHSSATTPSPHQSVFRQPHEALCLFASIFEEACRLALRSFTRLDFVGYCGDTH